MSKGKAFRTLVKQHPPVQCIGVYDAMTARLAAAAGAKALYVSGYAAAAIVTGMPDLSIISQGEMAEHIRRVALATPLPVIADADTGYGGFLNVKRTVNLWEAAGAAGFHMEDQVFPKRCGHVAGKAVIPVGEMVQKLRAACEARTDPDFFIIARTDAIAVTGIDDALVRCRAYAEAGADALFLDAPESEAQLQRIGKELGPLGKTLVFNAIRTGKTPPMSEEALKAIGFGAVIWPVETMLAAHKAATAVVKTILSTGSDAGAMDQMTSFKDFNAFIGMTEFVEGEKRYAAKV